MKTSDCLSEAFTKRLLLPIPLFSTPPSSVKVPAESYSPINWRFDNTFGIINFY